MSGETAPVLSTPDTHIFEDPTPHVQSSNLPKLSDEQLYITYEIKRTVDEIRRSRWRRIALQFPDHMLADGPRVYEALQRGLREGKRITDPSLARPSDARQATEIAGLATGLEKTQLQDEDAEEKLTILADTSYGACCVDEIAAEHVDADVVVHYGRSCLSPTARLPVIHVFTTQPLQLDTVVAGIQQTYPDKMAKIVLMADIPYSSHIPALASMLRAQGYDNAFATEVIHSPGSPLPNRTVPEDADLSAYSLFHISDPPTSLLLNVSSRLASIYIYPTTTSTPNPSAIEASTAQTLRRRYALVTRLATVSIFGILINTLSVKNYLSALSHVQDVIARAGKKSYTFVVGKVNAAKVANFSDVGGWVVIGCWESSLLESNDFWRPIITPFELELALTDESERVWSGEWNSNFEALLGKPQPQPQLRLPDTGVAQQGGDAVEMGDGDAEDSEEESEPPVFDLRTGRYVSQTRPMARPARPSQQPAAHASSSLIKRANGDLAQIGGQVSPAAEYLRSQRTWQGLGSDYEVAYEYDDEGGKVRGAQMEQGRAGIAKGYSVGDGQQQKT